MNFVDVILDEQTERDVATSVMIAVTVLLRHRHRYDACVLEEIAAANGAGNARLLELREVRDARHEAWREMYRDGMGASPRFDRLNALWRRA